MKTRKQKLVNITLHEIQLDGKIKNLEQAFGGAWGGTYLCSVKRLLERRKDQCL